MQKTEFEGGLQLQVMKKSENKHGINGYGKVKDKI